MHWMHPRRSARRRGRAGRPDSRMPSPRAVRSRTARGDSDARTRHTWHRARRVPVYPGAAPTRRSAAPPFAPTRVATTRATGRCRPQSNGDHRDRRRVHPSVRRAGLCSSPVKCGRRTAVAVSIRLQRRPAATLCVGGVGDTLRLTLAGAAIGIVGAIALSSLLSSLPFGVSPIDPWTYAGTAAILLLVAVAAGFIPAFRPFALRPCRRCGRSRCLADQCCEPRRSVSFLRRFVRPRCVGVRTSPGDVQPLAKTTVGLPSPGSVRLRLVAQG